jgi:hypothetical protein
VGGIASLLLLLLLMNCLFAKNELGFPVIGGPGRIEGLRLIPKKISYLGDYKTQYWYVAYQYAIYFYVYGMPMTYVDGLAVFGVLSVSSPCLRVAVIARDQIFAFLELWDFCVSYVPFGSYCTHVDTVSHSTQQCHWKRNQKTKQMSKPTFKKLRAGVLDGILFLASWCHFIIPYRGSNKNSSNKYQPRIASEHIP